MFYNDKIMIGLVFKSEHGTEINRTGISTNGKCKTVEFAIGEFIIGVRTKMSESKLGFQDF